MYSIDLRTAAHRPKNYRRRTALVLGQLADLDGPDLNYRNSEIAAMADTQTEHVARTVAAFCRAGILSRKGSVLSVVDRDALDREVTA